MTAGAIDGGSTMRREIGPAMAAVVLALFGTFGVVGAAVQPATPGASPVAGTCDVEPRTEEDLERLAVLAATPAAEELAVDEGWPPGGEDADAATRSALEESLAEVAACEASGEIGRLLALYTDDFIVREVLATEPVAIVPGTPEAVPVAGTSEPISATVSVREARLLPDGQVAALVERGGRTEIVVFADVDGMWRVDEVRQVATGEGTPVASPGAGVTDELAGLPPVVAAIADAAVQLGVGEADVTVVSVEPVVWPDASLGCPEPGGFYAQVETRGYWVVLGAGGDEVTYHTDETGVVVLCEEGDE